MAKISLVSWNINGIRAAERKDFLVWLKKSKHDIVGLQETKISGTDQISANLLEPDGYKSFWSCATTRKGYSGVALYTKVLPTEVKLGLDSKKFDTEGRIVVARYPKFTFITGYYPNGGSGPDRLKYKLEFYDYFLAYIEKLRKKGEKVIFCGDINTAHTAIDLARPKDNAKNTGFLPIERAWIDKVVAAGWVDTFRHFYPTKTGAYSYWDQKSRARDRNVGWRIDYFFVSPNLVPHLKKAFILDDVLGSDHCPVGIELEL